VRARFDSLLLALVVAPLLCGPRLSVAQSSYPASSEIAAQPLVSDKREQLTAIIHDTLAPALRKRTIEQLCQPISSEAPSSDPSTKQALTILETKLATEILFERAPKETSANAASFGLFVEFMPNRALLKHLSPRYQSEAGGFSVPYPTDKNRVLRLEGKNGTDVVALIPAVGQCAVRSVVLCARSYESTSKLVESHFIPRSARELISAKADGLFAPRQGSNGKTQASLLATKNIALPQQWFASTISSDHPAATIKHAVARELRESLPPFVPFSLPWIAAVESRLDFGTETTTLRTVTKRTTVELAEFTLPSIPDLRIGASEFSFQGGSCYLLSEWTESAL